MIVGVSTEGTIYEAKDFLTVDAVRKLPDSIRHRNAGVQMLVYKHNCYLGVMSLIGIECLAGVKTNPLYWPYSNQYLSHNDEKCECCCGLSHSHISRHYITKKHVLRKWNVDKEKALKEMERTRIILRLKGWELNNDNLPF